MMDDGPEINGMIYIMKLIRPTPPANSYNHGIVEACRTPGIRDEILTVLQPAPQRSLDRAWS